jgi:hypothetical protein
MPGAIAVAQKGDNGNLWLPLLLLRLAQTPLLLLPASGCFVLLQPCVLLCHARLFAA